MRQFISCTIGSEEYGIDIMSIREIKGWVPASHLPEMPAYFRGVIDLRGTIIPILDLRARFGAAPTEPTARHVIMVVAVGDKMAGILVDAVADILAIDDKDIQPVPELESDASHAFLSGLVTVDGRMVAILDLNAVFDTHDIAQVQAA
ncbi:MAG: chemotaxis protein CheW [Actinomycetota bacterium]